MDIDSIQWKSIIVTVFISLWLPQLLITDALQVENNNTHSCDNGTEIDSFRKSWPSPIPFEPYDEPSSSQKEFIPAVASSTSTPPPSTLSSPLLLQNASGRIEPTPTIIRYLISPTLPLNEKLSPSLRPLLTSPASSYLISSSMLVPSPLFNSSVRSTPINELKSRPSLLLNSASFSSLVQPSPVLNGVESILSPSSPIFNDSVTFPLLNASHTVTPDMPTHRHSDDHHHHHHHGQQPSRTMLIDGSIYRVNQSESKDLRNDPLTTTVITTNYDNVTTVNKMQTTSIDFLSPLANPKDNHSEIINEDSLSHNVSPTSSSFFPLSGTISFIPSGGGGGDTTTTDITFPWTSNDNIIYYNGNNETNEEGGGDETQNHHEIPEAATSNTTKCDHRENRFTQPAPESGFLVRSVLKRYQDESPLSLDNLTAIFETRLADIFNLAYRNQLKGLGVRPDNIVKDIHVKLWNLFWNNSTDNFHLIYQIEQDNHMLLAQDLQTLLSHLSPEEMSTILGYNGTIKAEPYAYTTSERKNSLASALKDLDWLPFAMIFLSMVVLIFCSLLSLIVWRKNRRLRSSSPNSSIGALGGGGGSGGPGPGRLASARLNKTKSSMAKPIGKISTKESLVNWRKVSGPGSKRSFLGSHGGSAVGLNLSGGCSATSGTIDSNHEFEYLSFDSPTSSLKLRTAEYRPRRPYTGYPNHGLHGSQSRLELTKEKVIPIGELDEIAELSSNCSSHDTHHPHHHHQHQHHLHQINNHHQQHPRVTYVTTKEEMIGDYENPLMRTGGGSGVGVGVDEVDCSVPQLIQVQISEQTQNIIQAIRSELKKFNPITGTNVQSQSIPTTQLKESTSTSDA